MKILIIAVLLLCVFVIFVAAWNLGAEKERLKYNNQMCFSLSDGDLRNGVLLYCEYVYDGCWQRFMNWSGGHGQYWNREGSP